jgi:hypothetical protein
MKTLATSGFCLLVSACASYDGYSLRAGTSTESEVRSVMGTPANEFANADGSRRLAYPRGPMGTQTYMADVGTDGVLKAVTPVLKDDTFYRIRPGLTREDILRMIGPPGETMAFARLGQVAWDYRYQDSWGYVAIFSVMFDANGIVVGKFTRRIERDRARN